MPINPDLLTAAVNALSSNITTMRRAQMTVEYALMIMIDQGVFNPANPTQVPDGAIVDAATGRVQGTPYTWTQFAQAAEALFAAAGDLNTVMTSDGVTSRATAMNRLATQ